MRCSRRVAVLALLVAGCAPRPLLERAIRARGGPLHSLVREAEADVKLAFPGTWPYRTAFLAPDAYAWVIYTLAQPDSYLFDGTTTRAFVGTDLVSVDASPTAALRTHARFTAVASLDALLLPGARVAALATADLPDGAATGLAVALADDGARYRLGFDAKDRLVVVEGPLALPPLGAGTVTARYDDFRRARGFVLPFHTAYAFAGRPIADERASAVCPDDAALTREAFLMPGRVPRCTAPR